MTIDSASSLGDSAASMPLPGDVLAQVRESRRVAQRAEAEIVALALEWAHAHPADPEAPQSQGWRPVGGIQPWVEADPAVVFAADDPEAVLDYGIPPVAWDAPAAFAAANSMSTLAGKSLIRDALVLAHRLPLLHRQVLAGVVPVWRARRIVQAALGAPVDVCDHLDTTLHQVAATVGAITLQRLIDEAMIRLHPEQVELDSYEALEARHVHLHESSMGHTGIAEMTIRGDWADLVDFDHTVEEVAAAMLTHPDHASDAAQMSRDVRRAVAVGILADPGYAQDLLDHEPPEQPDPDPTPDQPAKPAKAPGRKPRSGTVLHLHLSETGVLGSEILGRNQNRRAPELVELLRAWSGRPHRFLTVQPVIDLREQIAVDAYEIPDRLATHTRLVQPTCVFPWCETSSTRADLDHIVAYDTDGPPGQTSSANLAPLCRHHHRLKTHAGWGYTPLDPGTYLWTDPHGQKFLVTPHGTRLLPD